MTKTVEVSDVKKSFFSRPKSRPRLYFLSLRSFDINSLLLLVGRSRNLIFFYTGAANFEPYRLVFATPATHSERKCKTGNWWQLMYFHPSTSSTASTTSTLFALVFLFPRIHWHLCTVSCTRRGAQTDWSSCDDVPLCGKVGPLQIPVFWGSWSTFKPFF